MFWSTAAFSSTVRVRSGRRRIRQAVCASAASRTMLTPSPPEVPSALITRGYWAVPSVSRPSSPVDMSRRFALAGTTMPCCAARLEKLARELSNAKLSTGASERRRAASRLPDAAEAEVTGWGAAELVAASSHWICWSKAAARSSPATISSGAEAASSPARTEASGRKALYVCTATTAGTSAEGCPEGHNNSISQPASQKAAASCAVEIHRRVVTIRVRGFIGTR